MSDMKDKELILGQYEDVKGQIIHGCLSSHRQPHEVTLIVVSKFQPVTKIRWLLEAGQREFAESRVEEMEEKWEPLLQEYPDVSLHYIGQIQSRKIQQIIKYSHVVHSLDRLSIAEKMARECEKLHKSMECLIQVNTGSESQKAGIHPADFQTFLKASLTMHPLIIKGLMCIPPVNQDPTPHFRILQQLKIDSHLPELSMGMSNDYMKAIACGATMLRIGTRIMGARP